MLSTDPIWQILPQQWNCKLQIQFPEQLSQNICRNSMQHRHIITIFNINSNTPTCTNSICSMHIVNIYWDIRILMLFVTQISATIRTSGSACETKILNSILPEWFSFSSHQMIATSQWQAGDARYVVVNSPKVLCQYQSEKRKQVFLNH